MKSKSVVYVLVFSLMLFIPITSYADDFEVQTSCRESNLIVNISEGQVPLSGVTIFTINKLSSTNHEDKFITDENGTATIDSKSNTGFIWITKGGFNDRKISVQTCEHQEKFIPLNDRTDICNSDEFNCSYFHFREYLQKEMSFTNITPFNPLTMNSSKVIYILEQNPKGQFDDTGSFVKSDILWAMFDSQWVYGYAAPDWLMKLDDWQSESKISNVDQYIAYEFVFNMLDENHWNGKIPRVDFYRSVS